jgi:hypothetical protein
LRSWRLGENKHFPVVHPAESGNAEGIAAAKAKAKSFVSCAVGRISGED